VTLYKSESADQTQNLKLLHSIYNPVVVKGGWLFWDTASRYNRTQQTSRQMFLANVANQTFVGEAGGKTNVK